MPTLEGSPKSACELLSDGHALRLGGGWPAAIASYETAIRAAVSSGNAAMILEAILAIGHSLREAGTLPDAEESYDLALVLATLLSDPGIASRALNGLAIIKQELGEVKQAAQLYIQAAAMAEEVGDLLGQGNIQQNLGTLAGIRGDLLEARSHYSRAQECFERLGHARGLAGVLNNLGMLYVDTGEHIEAEACFARALELAREAGDLTTQGIVYVNRAELYIDLGAPQKARGSCDEAFEIASSLNDDRIKADAIKLLGVLFRDSNKLELAESHLIQAVELSRRRGNTLTHAEALREYALTLRLLGRNREALQYLYEAYTLFQRLHASHEQDSIDREVSRLQDDFLAVVAAWGESIEAADVYTRGHCQRVADYACRLALAAGLPPRELFWFRMGAFLHDVGKTEIPQSLLNKTGRLTSEERTLMEAHTFEGVELLAHIDFPWDIKPMIRSHHERWDGQGYPDGLRGEEIPLTARILSCADVFDALTTRRSYRAAMNFVDALAVMEADSGALDPALLSTFKAIVYELQPHSHSDRLVAASVIS